METVTRGAWKFYKILEDIEIYSSEGELLSIVDMSLKPMSS